MAGWLDRNFILDIRLYVRFMAAERNKLLDGFRIGAFDLLEAILERKGVARDCLAVAYTWNYKKGGTGSISLRQLVLFYQEICILLV